MVYDWILNKEKNKTKKKTNIFFHALSLKPGNKEDSYNFKN